MDNIEIPMNVMGYFYIDSHWIETDDGKQLKLKQNEFEYVSVKSENFK